MSFSSDDSMDLKFEQIILKFLEQGIGVSNRFLTADLTIHLKENLLELYKNNRLKLAGVGNENVQNHNKEYRNDKIFWLDRKNNNPYEKLFFDLIESFITYLNKTCFTAIKTYEFHYAFYEKGSFYKKHLDQFKSDGSRAFSMIFYLNEGWLKKDGGELKVYQESGIQLISPENQKCVFFKSDEIPHEVLTTNVSRMSVTGWLKT